MNRILFKLLRYSGLPFLFREIIQRKKVTILMFHDIGRETAERAFGYLSKRYRIIGLNDFLEAQVNCKSLPEKALVVTFDDGHIGNYQLLPVFKKYNIQPTIFLCAGIINTKRHFWFTYRHPALSTSVLKKLPNSERQSIMLKAGFSREKEFEQPQALTKPQIHEMKSTVNFQAHTLFHPCLTTCTAEEAQQEIAISKAMLEREYNLPVNAFAFPNGDYSLREIDLVKEAGYQCALTVDLGFNGRKADVFKLKRLSVNDTDNMDELIVKSSGVWAFLKNGINAL